MKEQKEQSMYRADCSKAEKATKNMNSKTQGRNYYRNKGRKPKEVEINVKAKSMNSADLGAFGMRDGSSGKNDPRFWNKFTSIAENAARIPFNTKLGVPITLQPKVTSNSAFNLAANNSNNIAAPGICVMRFAPVVGKCDSSLSPLNTLLTSSYAWYRTNYRAASKYEPADIGIYYVAIASATMLWAEFVRICGLVRAAKARNLYSAQLLVRSLGYNFSDLARNLADLESDLNVFASQIRRWAIPKDLSVVARWVQLSSNVYADSQTETAQLYVWQTEGYYAYEEGTDAAYPAGKLVWHSFAPLRSSSATTPIGVGTPLPVTLSDDSLIDYDYISSLLNSILQPHSIV